MATKKIIPTQTAGKAKAGPGKLLSDTLFPTPRRQIQQTQGTGQVVREVRSEDELRAAIGAIAVQAPGATTENPGIAFGATILISQRFSVSAPIRIPQSCIGLTISSAAKFPITAVGVVSSLFEIDAYGVTIRDMFVLALETANMFTAFVTIPSDAADPSRHSLLNNIVFTDRLYVDAAGLASGAYIEGNEHREVNGTHGASIESLGTRGVILGNRLADGGGDTITLGAGSSDWRIVGNDCGDGDITTSAGNGGNRLASNANVGTKTLHADDIDCDNQTTSWTTVTKTSTETIQSDTTLSDDAELVFPVAANTTYRFRGYVFVKHGGTTADFKYKINGPASPTLFNAMVKHGNSSLTIDSSDDYAGTENTFTSGITGRPTVVEIAGVIENGANAGSIAFQWAQAVSVAEDLSILKGSYIEYAEVA